MTRSRAALAVVVLALGAACGGGAPDGVGIGDLRYLPATARIVASVDVRALRAAPTFGPYERMVLREVEGGLNQLQAWCNLDVRALLGRVSIGITPTPDDPDDGDAIVVVHGIPRDRAIACIADLGAQQPGVVERDGDVFAVGRFGVTATFVDATTLVAAVRADRTPGRAMLDDAVAGRGTLPSNPDLDGLIRHLDTTGTAWAVGDLMVLPDVGDSARALGGASLWAGVSLRAGDTATATVRMRTSDAATAEQLRGLVIATGGAARGKLARLDARVVGTGVVVDLQATAAQLPEIIESLAR